MQSKIYLTLFLFITVTLSARPAKAQTIIYNTVSDGNWTSNATWHNGASGKPPTSGNCNCTININEGHRVTINQNVNISNANIILQGAGSEIRFSSEILFAQTMQLSGSSSIEIRNGGNIQSTSNFFGYNGNSISINGTSVFQGYSTQVNSSTRGSVTGPASATSSTAPPIFINSVLPIKLYEFEVKEHKEKMVLNWKAGESENFDRFEIERSTNGINWLTIGTVDAPENSSAAIKYAYIDQMPVNGANYYRLKMIDIDARFEYSKVVVSTISALGTRIKVYPNPVESALNILVNQPVLQDYNIKLINRSGQLIYNRKHVLQGNKISINTDFLSRGNYFLEMTDKTGELIHSSVIQKRY